MKKLVASIVLTMLAVALQAGETKDAKASAQSAKAASCSQAKASCSASCCSGKKVVQSPKAAEQTLAAR